MATSVWLAMIPALLSLVGIVYTAWSNRATERHKDAQGWFDQLQEQLTDARARIEQLEKRAAQQDAREMLWRQHTLRLEHQIYKGEGPPPVSLPDELKH